MQDLAEQFRQAGQARSAGRRSPGRYPDQLRDLALSHLSRVREVGGKANPAARELGIDVNTLRGWEMTSASRDLGRAARGPPGEESLLEWRRRMRDEESRRLVEASKCWATELRVLPQSSLGRAMKYMTDYWSGLVRFLENPKIPLSNNDTERAVRGPVVGPKN